MEEFEQFGQFHVLVEILALLQDPHRERLGDEGFVLLQSREVGAKGLQGLLANLRNGHWRLLAFHEVEQLLDLLRSALVNVLDVDVVNNCFTGGKALDLEDLRQLEQVLLDREVLALKLSHTLRDVGEGQLLEIADLVVQRNGQGSENELVTDFSSVAPRNVFH